MQTIRENALQEINEATTLEQLQQVRNTYLSKKGLVSSLMKQMKDLSNEEKPLFGQKVNELKNELEEAYQIKQAHLQQEALNQRLEKERIDITLPATPLKVGQLHPLMMVWRALEDIFREMGYNIVEGNDVDTDFYNFERANIPQDHPARDMQDTFYIDMEHLLRTHTTAIQTRALEMYAPHLPIKVVCPGKVYRKDDDDATHSHQFMQMEGLVVGMNITLADLKGTLELLVRSMFGQERVIRFRPSYFQFTEPSVEVDVSCHVCDGKGCSVCKQTGWIEILGAGMVHPAVLEMAGYESQEGLSGFAFGVGIERVAMLKYGVSDIRQFYTNDQRFLEQFKRFE
ncbi:MAG: phenylalanine--tRNA ligase subunit alpha [Erysipelothrix sp.]|nr:phenylalanine--tRNA ligase subunit alpha [Erysipelothrix sp.]